MKQITLSFLLMLQPLMASADPVEIDGIWYNLVSKVKTAEVTKMPSGYYSGAIEIPEKVTYGGLEYTVTSIGDYALAYSSELSAVKIPNKVTSIGENAFRFCSGLTSITISNSVTSIERSAFYNCSGLTSITIPNSVTSIESSTFAYCTSLTSITIPNSVTSIGGSTFSNCTSLTSITIPNSVTSIESSTFYNCTNMTSISIPNNMTSIGNSAFKNCSNLTSINLPNSVTNIGKDAFSGCIALTSITIGSGVEKIYESAFSNCPELTDVICMTHLLTTSEWEGEGLYTYSDAFEGSYIEYGTLHVPASAINTYKTTAPWSGFGKIVAIEGGDTPAAPKCAKPTISFENGKIKFSCETEGVDYISEITTADTKKYYDGEVTPTFKYNVSVYAIKEGYENSDTVTAEITATGTFGDLTGDGKVDVADHVKLSEIIMNQK